MNEYEQTNSPQSGNLAGTAREAWSSAKDRTSDVIHSGERYARENPVPAICTAFGIGFLLGLLSGWCLIETERESYADSVRRAAKNYRRKLHLD